MISRPEPCIQKLARARARRSGDDDGMAPCRRRRRPTPSLSLAGGIPVTRLSETGTLPLMRCPRKRERGRRGGGGVSSGSSPLCFGGSHSEVPRSNPDAKMRKKRGDCTAHRREEREGQGTRCHVTVRLHEGEGGGGWGGGGARNNEKRGGEEGDTYPDILCTAEYAFSCPAPLPASRVGLVGPERGGVGPEPW